jgi:hypothetical protein
MHNKINPKFFQEGIRNIFKKKIYSKSIKKFSGLAKFDFTDPLNLEGLLTEEERMVKKNIFIFLRIKKFIRKKIIHYKQKRFKNPHMITAKMIYFQESLKQIVKKNSIKKS